MFRSFAICFAGILSQSKPKLRRRTSYSLSFKCFCIKDSMYLLSRTILYPSGLSSISKVLSLDWSILSSIDRKIELKNICTSFLSLPSLLRISVSLYSGILMSPRLASIARLTPPLIRFDMKPLICFSKSSFGFIKPKSSLSMARTRLLFASCIKSSILSIPQTFSATEKLLAMSSA